MSRFQLEAQEQMDVLAYLEALVGCVKSLQGSVEVLMADVAAIRNTVYEDPEETALYRTKLKLAMATGRPKIDGAMRSYDDLIQEIADSQQYKN